MKVSPIVLLLSLLAVLFPPCPAAAVEPDEEDPYYLLTEQASQAIKDEKFDAAAARLMEAMSIRPDAPENVMLLSNLGMVYSYQGKDSLALATFDEALRRAPSMRTVLLNRAGLLLRMDRDKEAIADLSKVIAVDSLNLKARYLRGMAAIHSRNLPMAQEDCEIMRTKAPDSDDTAEVLSLFYVAQGRSRDALPFLKTLVDRVPDANTYATLADCYIDLGEYSDAGATIKEGLEKFPDNGELYLCRAELGVATYRLDEAHADARKARMLGVPAKVVEAIFKK